MPQRPERTSRQPPDGYIPLDEAFLGILECFEELEGVPLEERMGLLPGQVDAWELHRRGKAEEPHVPEAAGPAYVRRFGVPEGVSPKDGSGMDASLAAEELVPRSPKSYRPSSQLPPKLPRLPNKEQLEALNEDFEFKPELISVHERCLVKADRWLMEKIKSGVIKMAGDLALNVNNGPVAIEFGAQEISREDIWDEFFIYNYSDGTAKNERKPIQMNSLRPVVGVGRYTNCRVFKEDLCREAGNLDFSSNSDVVVRFYPSIRFFEDSGAYKICKIWWKDKEYVVDLTGRERVERGLLALAVMLKYSGKPVAHYLLYNLAGRGTETKKQTAAARESAEKLRQEVLPLARDLLNETEDLTSLHLGLEKILCQKGREDVVLKSWADWNQKTTGRPRKPRTSVAFDGISKNNKATLDAVLKDGIDERTGRVVDGVLPVDLAAYFRDRLNYSAGSAWLRVAEDQINWTIRLREPFGYKEMRKAMIAGIPSVGFAVAATFDVVEEFKFKRAHDTGRKDQ